MLNNKNVLIAVNSGIIALDVKNQLKESGYNAEIINLANKQNIKESLEKNFHLVILEKSSFVEGSEYISALAQENGLPVIYLSSEDGSELFKHRDLKNLVMPFGKDELIELIKITLEDGKSNL